VAVAGCCVRIVPSSFQVLCVGPRLAPLQQQLRSLGFVTRHAADGTSGWQSIQQAPVHLLLVELEPGGIFAVELAKRAADAHVAGAIVLADEPLRTQPIIAAMVRPSFAGFLPLPLEPAALLKRVEDVLLVQMAAAQAVQLRELELVMQAKNEAMADTENLLAHANERAAALATEVQSLRSQLKSMHLVAGIDAASGTSGEGKTLPLQPLQPTPPRRVTPAPMLFEDPPTTPGMVLSDDDEASLRDALQEHSATLRQAAPGQRTSANAWNTAKLPKTDAVTSAEPNLVGDEEVLFVDD
jgi:DNA-binding response OmpR family regulator